MDEAHEEDGKKNLARKTGQVELGKNRQSGRHVVPR
jgi:hypothetical protein